MIENLEFFNNRVSKISNKTSLINEARENTRRIDFYYGLPIIVGVAGVLGALSLLKREAIPPELAYSIFSISFCITYIPYIDIFCGGRRLARKDMLDERAERLQVVLPKGPTERIFDWVARIAFPEGGTEKKQ